MQDAHSYVPGFEALSHNLWLPKIVKKHLTTTLCKSRHIRRSDTLLTCLEIAKVTAPLSEEATLALQKVLTDSPGKMPLVTILKKTCLTVAAA